MSLTAIIVTIAVLAASYFMGLLRPTGLLSPKVRSGAPVRPGLRAIAPLLLILIAMGTFWTSGYLGMWYRLQIATEGTVIARQDFPRTQQTHGPSTLYRLRRNDGTISGYVATDSDGSLPRTIPVGSSLSKHRWDLFYVVDGKRVDDFPLTVCLVALAMGLACLVGAVVLLTRDRMPQASDA